MTREICRPLAVAIALVHLWCSSAGAQPVDFVALANTAFERLQQGRQAEAMALADRAEAAGASSSDLPRTLQTARGWNRLGMTLFNLGYFERARAAYLRASDIVTDDPDLLNNLGQAEYRLRNLEKAREYLEGAVARRRAAAGTNPHGLAVALDNLATVLVDQRELDRAEGLHQEAFDIFAREGRTALADAATVKSNLGVLYRLKHDYTRAESYAVDALNVHRTLLGVEDPQTIIDITNLAQLYLEVGNDTRLNQFANQIVAMGGPAPGKEHLNAAHMVYFLAGEAQGHWQLGLAERLAARAFDLFTAINGARDTQTLKALSLLALVQSAKSEYPSAERNFLRLLEVHNAQGNTAESAAVMVQLAKVYRNQRAYQPAIALLERAIAALAAAPADERASAAGNLAQVFTEADNPSAAEKAYADALAIVADRTDSRELPWLLHGQALLRYHLGKYEQAQQGLERARDIWTKTLGANHPFVTTTVANLALVAWARQDAAAAFDLLSRVAAMRERDLQSTLTVGSERERIAYAKDMLADLSKLLSLCFAANRCDGDAARVSATVLLQRKGRVLDAMTDTMRQVREELGAEDRTLIYRLEEVRRSISARMSPAILSGEPPAASTSLETLLREETELQTAISYKSAAYAATVQPVTVDSVRGALPAGATLVEYIKYSVFAPVRSGSGTPWRGERYAALVLIRDTAPRWVDLGPAERIDSAVQQFRTTLRNREVAYGNADAADLHTLLVAPLALTLPRATQSSRPLLLIAPDGPLTVMPFGLLAGRTGPSLGERFVIDYVSSGRDLVQQRARTSSKEVVVIANPDFDADVERGRLEATMRSGVGGFRPLPGTATEARQLEQLFDNARAFTGAKATVSTLKAVERPAVLHIATHGIFMRMDNVERPQAADVVGIGDRPFLLLHTVVNGADNPLLFSGLALAGANRADANANDAMISALEISGLHLQGTELVVLSACETGLGTTRFGEEFSGLRRAISIAGAASQVTSLWKVDDTATAALFARYYDLLRQGIGRAEALQRAQQHIRDDHPEWRHPFYWAAFIPSGDWKPMAQLAARR